MSCVSGMRCFVVGLMVGSMLVNSVSACHFLARFRAAVNPCAAIPAACESQAVWNSLNCCNYSCDQTIVFDTMVVDPCCTSGCLSYSSPPYATPLVDDAMIGQAPLGCSNCGGEFTDYGISDDGSTSNAGISSNEPVLDVPPPAESTPPEIDELGPTEPAPADNFHDGDTSNAFTSEEPSASDSDLFRGDSRSDRFSDDTLPSDSFESDNAQSEGIPDDGDEFSRSDDLSSDMFGDEEGTPFSDTTSATNDEPLFDESPSAPSTDDSTGDLFGDPNGQPLPADDADMFSDPDLTSDPDASVDGQDTLGFDEPAPFDTPAPDAGAPTFDTPDASAAPSGGDLDFLDEEGDTDFGTEEFGTEPAGSEADDFLDNLDQQGSNTSHRDGYRLVSVERHQFPSRFWSDASGQFNTMGRLVDVGPQHVRLLKENGRHATVNIRQLSRIDRAYVQAVQTIAAEHSATPAESLAAAR